MSDTYEVTVGPAAIRMILNMPDPKELADSLRTELVRGPNAGKEFRFDSDGNSQIYSGPSTPRGVVYTATPLSFDGYTAIHRPMTRDELMRLEVEQGRRVAERGFYVLDILPAESGFARKPQLR